MTAFCFVVATVPLALYWLALAWLHFRPRPFAIDGRRDSIALAFALFGVFFIGPGSVTPSLAALTAWGAGVWLLCGLLYFCVVVLLSSSRRPRLVVYNATCEETRAVLERVALLLDSDARWAGTALEAPNLDVRLYVDGAALGRVATLVGLDAPRSRNGWLLLEKELRGELARLKSPRGRAWAAFAALGGSALLAAVVVLWTRQEAIADALSFYLFV